MAIIAPLDQAIQHRHPIIVATDGYLNDPITFNVDRRFDPDTVLKNSDTFNMVDRDLADFAIVDLGASDVQSYGLETYINTYTRENYQKILNNA